MQKARRQANKYGINLDAVLHEKEEMVKKIGELAQKIVDDIVNDLPTMVSLPCLQDARVFAVERWASLEVWLAPVVSDPCRSTRIDMEKEEVIAQTCPGAELCVKQCVIPEVEQDLEEEPARVNLLKGSDSTTMTPIILEQECKVSWRSQNEEEPAPTNTEQVKQSLEVDRESDTQAMLGNRPAAEAKRKDVWETISPVQKKAKLTTSLEKEDLEVAEPVPTRLRHTTSLKKDDASSPKVLPEIITTCEQEFSAQVTP